MENPRKKILTNNKKEIPKITNLRKSKLILNGISTDNIINEGDLVIFQIARTELKSMFIELGAKFNCRQGLFHHSDFIGKEYGSKVFSRDKKKYIYVLRPTPALHTLSLKHRTQILYDLDISLVLFYLDLKPGCFVVESGTGSGGLSTAIAQCVAPKGALFTFEYHEERFLKAKKEFDDNKLSEIITIFHRDVYKEGFNDVCKENSVDAVFLDLPEPWKCMDSVHRILKTGKRFCSFSPCIEQTQKTVKKLNELKFCEIKSIETVKKQYYFGRFKTKSVNPDKKEYDTNYTIG